MNLGDFIPENFGNLKITVGAVAAVASMGYGGYSWLASSFVRVEDFKRFEQRNEQRILFIQKSQLEVDVLRLHMKHEVYPKSFDAVDKAILEKQEELLRQTDDQLQKIRDRENG